MLFKTRRIRCNSQMSKKMRIYSTPCIVIGLVYAPVMHLKYIILWLHWNRLETRLFLYVSKHACTMTCHSDCLSDCRWNVVQDKYIKHETTNELSHADQTAPFSVSKLCCSLCILSGRKTPDLVTGGILVYHSSLLLTFELLIHYYCQRSGKKRSFTLPLEAVKELLFVY